MSKRPNILFLMSDEHRYDVAGFAGNDIVRTPTLDWLAKDGVVFTNAYTPSPICIPARQCMAAGQFPRTCRCERYGDDLEPEYMTFARRFSQYAYRTVCCGKLHHMGIDQLQGWMHYRSIHENVSPRYLKGKQDAEFEKYRALDAVEPTTGRTAPSRKWSDEKEILRAGVGKSPHDAHDEFAMWGALDFLEKFYVDPYYDKCQTSAPLMLLASFCLPHYPYLIDEERFAYYLSRVRMYGCREVFDHPFLSERQADAPERDVVRAIAAYYGMTEKIDWRYGRILEALRKYNQDLDDWIIVYTSDHGEMLGEHGVWEKQKFFEGSVKVPLIIRWPKGLGPGRVVDRNVNLCDLFATLCSLADIPAPEGLDSRDLSPLLRGEDVDWDNESVSQFGGRNLMIKRDALKYQYYGPSMPEVLFDLERNPSETVNFIDDPGYADALTRFRARKAELGF